MKIFVVSMKSHNSYSYIMRSVVEDYFDNVLAEMGHCVQSFDFGEVLIEKGKMEMNKIMYENVIESRPDVILFVPYQNEFLPENIKKISNQFVTLAYFFDDSWRVDYCAFWSKYYRFVTTSSINGIQTWRNRGCDNFIFSPFGANISVFKKLNTKKKYDITFVGSYHPYRAWILRRLKRKGFSVNVWGLGWPNGEVSQTKMVEIFNTSKINLNLSNNDFYDLSYIFEFRRPILETLRVFKKILFSFFTHDNKVVEMVKARHFEICSCGSFQISFCVEGLEKYFEFDSEIVVFNSITSLTKSLKFYLDNDYERELIAERGYHRAIKDHSLQKRFANLIFTIENQLKSVN